MKVEMTERNLLIAQAQVIGATLLEHDSHMDSRIDAQARVKLYDAHQLFQKLENPVRQKNDYKLLFDCWASHAMFPGCYVIEEQTGLVVRRSNPNGSARSLDSLHQEFCLYTQLFGIEVWSENKFYTEVLKPLETVNTFQMWLNKLPKVSAADFKDKTGVEPDRLCERLTGNKNLLINKLWSYHFTGLINRVINPGCKLDSMLILISKQKGWNKTRFLSALTDAANTKNYVSVYSLDAGDVELCKLIQGKAVINIDECDAAMKGKCAAKTKAFLTTQVDVYRPSYGRKAIEQPRCGAFFGTSNNLEIIQDLGGDRRFYPVLLEQVIDIEWFEENKALIYGYYKWLWSTGGKTHPTNDEELDLVKGIQPQFTVQPLYFERLAEFLSYCKDKNFAFSTTDLLHAVGPLLDNQPKYEKVNVESLIQEYEGTLSKAKLSTGVQPSSPKWSFAPLATLLTRVELKRQYEGWDQSH